MIGICAPAKQTKPPARSHNSREWVVLSQCVYFETLAKKPFDVLITFVSRFVLLVCAAVRARFFVRCLFLLLFYCVNWINICTVFKLMAKCKRQIKRKKIDLIKIKMKSMRATRHDWATDAAGIGFVSKIRLSLCTWLPFAVAFRLRISCRSYGFGTCTSFDPLSTQ